MKQPQRILIMGLPGAGKTTLAQALWAIAGTSGPMMLNFVPQFFIIIPGLVYMYFLK